MLNSFGKLFSNNSGLTDLVEHDTVSCEQNSCHAKPYRTSKRQTEILKVEIQKMLKLGIIDVDYDTNK